MSAELTRRPDDFPPEVHESLAQLRALAKSAKSQDDWYARGRRATDEEVALAETLRHPTHCAGKSGRTGLPCTAPRIHGGAVCVKHGGQAPHIRQAADARLTQAIMPALARMIELSRQSAHLPTAQKAAADLLDRAEVGALVKAKVVQATKDRGASGVVVNIGFLGPDAQPVITIDPDQS